jgi:hypothetical protein
MPRWIFVAVAALVAAYAWYLRSDFHRRGNRLYYTGGRPNRLGRAVAQMSSAIYGTGLLPPFLVSLETTGYRTGRRHAIPVVLADHAGEQYIVSMLGTRSPSVRNIRAAGGRAIINHGKSREVHLEEVAPDARAPIIKAYLARAFDARPHFPVAWDAPLEAFEPIAADYPVFRIEATRQASAS